MNTNIPNGKWQPLSRGEVVETFADAPFAWGIAGGYAVEQFLGNAIREHGDMDVLVYRDQQRQVQRWLAEWQLYAADPPGTLRPWGDDEYLPDGIHDIWGHRRGVSAWQLQIMLAEVDGDRWFMRRNPEIHGQRDDLIVSYHGIPCVRIEVQLFYKARNRLPKDELDFRACLPFLRPEAKRWLGDRLRHLYPEGHPWRTSLA